MDNQNNNQNLFENDFVQHEEKYFGQYIEQINDLHGLALSLTEEMKENRIFITGFPFDEGTYLTGGRIGSENGPKSFRDYLQKEKIYFENNEQIEQKLRIFDIGDLNKLKQPDEDDDEYEEQEIQRSRQLSLQECHLSQRQIIGQLFDFNSHFPNNKSVVFAIGGSHDQTYSNILSLFDSYHNQSIGIIHIHSQFAVSTPTNHFLDSNSPIRLILENQAFNNTKSQLIQFGSKGSLSHISEYNYLIEKGSKIYFLEKNIRRYQLENNNDNDDNNNLQLQTQAGQLFNKILNELEKEVDRIFVSISLEVMCGKYCLGVSNPGVTGGLTDLEMVEIMQIIGRSKKLTLIDLSDYNPAVEHKRTGRLITNLFYSFAQSFLLSQSQK